MTSKSPRYPIARWPVITATLLCALLITASPAAAQPSAGSAKPCPTWFPDFRCDRHGRYDGFIAPMSMAYLFEDPFITTGVQFVTVWHGFPEHSVFEGGSATVLALQARVAITDRLAFIATKGGLTFFRPGLYLLDDQNGLMDHTVGFKYALIDMRDKNFIVTPSLRFEIPMGRRELFQGQGDGVFIPGISTGWRHDDLSVIADFGAQIPVNGDKNSTSLFYNTHVAYRIVKHFVPFVEVNGLHWTDGGNGSSIVETRIGPVPIGLATTVLGKAPFEGADVANLGSTDIRGADLVTMAWGARIPIGSHLSIGASYERPITGRKDIFEQRATAMVLVEF